MTGCAPYKNQFSCPAGSGIQCKSVSYVNEQVDHGNFNGAPKKQHGRTAATLRKSQVLVVHNNELNSGSPLVRVPEKTLRIWLNGFMDGADCYREEQYINKVIEKSRWETKQS
jgi:hypothetical protein